MKVKWAQKIALK